jgi:hypothetical protein
MAAKQSALAHLITMILNWLKSITPYGVTKPSYDLKVVPPQADRLPHRRLSSGVSFYVLRLHSL